MESMNYFIKATLPKKAFGRKVRTVSYELFNGQVSRRDNDDLSYCPEYRIVQDIDKEFTNLIKYVIGIGGTIVELRAKKITWGTED